MSGHSHFATIKRKKEVEDQKRGKIFSKMARIISVTAKEGGDPNMNPRLRQALDEAKKFNMPKDNIERAIKKGTGELAGEAFEEVLYEVLGPGGVSIILEGITDNKNRTLLEVKQVLQKNNCKLADEGSVKWAFEHKGIAVIIMQDQSEGKSKDDIEMAAIDAGAEDVRVYKEPEGDIVEIVTSIEGLEKAKETLEKEDIKIESSTLGWLAKEELEVSEQDKKKCEKVFDELDDNDAIQEVYSNLRI